MKIFFTLLVCGVLAYLGWHNFISNKTIEPLYEGQYVIVYGRDRCGLTQKYLKALGKKEIELIYEKVDEKEIADELHSRMQQAGLSTKRYNLPVIDVNGQIFIRPEIDTILALYDTEE